jgi:DNA-binding beta-propeller fold protein YncE
VLKRSGLTLLLLVLVAGTGIAATLAWRSWIGRTPVLDPRWGATVRLYAGDGTIGTRDGPGERAQFSDPFGVAVAADGTIFVTDAGGADLVRAISTDGRVRTVAGNGQGFADGTGQAARFSTPSGIAVDSAGILYVADTGNNAIRRITPDGVTTTLAGDGLAGYRDGPGAQARFNGPVGVDVDPGGRVIVADTYNDRVRAIAADGTVSTIAGSGLPGAIDGLAVHSQFDTPCGVVIDPSGRIHVADTGSGLLRMIDPTGDVSTHALSFPEGFSRPTGIALGAGGAIYLTDGRGRIVEVSPDGTTRTIAGSTPGFADGPGDAARFRSPAGIAATGPGRLVVADAGNALLRVVAAPSRVEVRPPASSRVAPRFDADRFGVTPLLWPVAPMEGPHEVAGTLGEARGAEGSERFHAGIDVRKEEGTPVLAIRDGIVSSPVSTDDFGSLNEWLRIGPLSYVHIRAGRSRRDEVLDAERFVPAYDELGQLARMRVKRGSRFAVGDAIGTVNAFNHVHLNVGWPGEEHNPLQFHLMHFEDDLPPTIAAGGVRVFDRHWQPLTRRARGRVVVSGSVQIVVDAWDQAVGNVPGRRLGLYDLGYQILNRDGTPAPGFDSVRHTLRFDRLTIDPEAARLAYAPGSGIPFYRGRRTRFLYVVTNTLNRGFAVEGAWDTTRLAPGDYVIRAWAADIHGNVAVRNRDLPITIVPPEEP